MRAPRIHYLDEGKGYPVLLIHGLGCSSSQWMYTVPSLRRSGFRAIAPDLPGFGQSELPDHPITSASYTDDIIRLMDDLRVERAVLVGNSMGGFVSWMTAAKHPDRVSALVLVDAAGALLDVRTSTSSKVKAEFGRANEVSHPRRKQESIRRVITNPILRPLLTSRLTDPITRRLVRRLIDTTFGDPARVTEEVFEMLHQSAKQARILFAGRLGWASPDRDPGILLEAVSCPTLVIWGDRDKIIPVDAKDFFMSHLRNAEEHVFPGVGHVPMLEVPDEFNRVVTGFLARVLGEPA